MQNRIRVFYILAAIVAASVVSLPGCSDSGPEETATTSVDEPEICKLEWWERVTDDMPDPIIDYDQKCVVQSWELLRLDEEPDCFGDYGDLVFEYRKNGVLVADAARHRGYGSQATFRLFNEKGDEIYVSSNKDAYPVGYMPEFVWYYRYDEKGRLTDKRSDYLHYYVVNDEFGLRDIWYGFNTEHDFPVYTDYGEVIEAERLETNETFGDCEHHIYKTDADPVVWPPTDDMIQDINESCTIMLHHVRVDGQETFRGYDYTYGSSNLDETWATVETSYNEKGLPMQSYRSSKKSESPAGDGGVHVSVTYWSYDDQGRVLREERDDSNDGSVERYEEHTYNGSVERVRTVNVRDDGEHASEYEIEYDAAGNIIRRDYFNDQGDPSSRSIQTYDAGGRLIYTAHFDSAYKDGSKVIADKPRDYVEYEYDAAGKLIREKRVEKNYSYDEDDEDEEPFHTVETFYEYDAEGRLTQKKQRDSDRWWVYPQGETHSEEERFWRRTVYRHHCE